jgi:Zn-dependent M28 family amino/carboxypeptidase
MKGYMMLICFFLGVTQLSAQDTDTLINKNEVERLEKILSADDMQGRAVFTPGIEKAADFITHEFKTSGLQPWDAANGYRQPFSMFRTKILQASLKFDGRSLDTRNLSVISSNPKLKVNTRSGFEKAFIRKGESFGLSLSRFIREKKNLLVIVDTSFSQNFHRFASSGRPQFKSGQTVILVLSAVDPKTYTIRVKQEITESNLANLVGILPGKSKKDEYVIFSAHYDHLGIGTPNASGDSIFNGANDDASGSTAVMMLAKYFSSKNDNERTLVFACFTAEEIGEYGSQYFSMQFDPVKVAAMFNIEMIGTESKWGTNSAYITGYERTNMGKILEKNLEGSQFQFYPDPYPQQQLFYRSDNASLARQGVPAHTISTSKMDSEKYYHTVGDEIGTLNIGNMTQIIKAIAFSATSIVSGKDTPSRVDTGQLR